jgi:putative hydrolase of the HAD superfamily
MVKGVFFDFYNTLAAHHPPRERVYAEVCRELGIQVEPKRLFISLSEADLYMRQETSRLPLNQRSDREKLEFYVAYITRVFAGAGVTIDRDTALQIIPKLQKRRWELKICDDTLPALEQLKARGLTIGLISNVIQDMEATFARFGLQPYLDFKVTSGEVGRDKPDPEIFLTALKKAGLQPQETIYVGDQYEIDIVGARRVGMKALLIDRNDYFPEITDCPRITDLTQILQYVS